jgi:2'-5' RNA ligase
MPTMWRTFIAVPLPQPVLATAAALQALLRGQGLRFKWVRPEGMHLTLKFLGDVDPDRVPEIGQALLAAAGTMAPFTLNARGLGVFPGTRKARVLWMGLEGQLDPLMALQAAVESELSRIGFAADERPFKAHLTLARIKAPIRLSLPEPLLSKVEKDESGPFTVERICLFRSELKPTGAVYTRLAEAELKGDRR